MPAALATADVSAPQKPVANAQISLATPGQPKAADPSGLNGAMFGRTFQQSVQADHFNVPLPPGQWVMLAHFNIHTPTSAGHAYFLGHIEHRRLVGGVRLFALHSNDQPGAGFPAAKGCVIGNPNANYVYIESITANDHQGCWIVDHYFTPPLQQWADRATRISALDRAVGGDLAAKGVDYPQDLPTVRFTRAEKWGVLEVTYLFDPELDGIQSANALSVSESDWHAANISRFPEKVAYVAKLRAWGEGFWPKFQQAFDSGKPLDTAAASTPAAAASAP
ncbi:hypothetical protein GCM10027093_59990 [Paraburkholderia jirisanensis]